MDWINIIPTAAIAVTAVGAIIYRTSKLISILNDVKDVVERMAKLEERVDSLEKHGVTIPMCETKEVEQNNIFCKKIEDLHKKLDKFEEKSEDLRRVNDQRWINVFSSLSNIEGQIKKMNGD